MTRRFKKLPHEALFICLNSNRKAILNCSCVSVYDKGRLDPDVTPMNHCVELIWPRPWKTWVISCTAQVHHLIDEFVSFQLNTKWVMKILRWQMLLLEWHLVSVAFKNHLWTWNIRLWCPAFLYIYFLHWYNVFFPGLSTKSGMEGLHSLQQNLPCASM